jgi:signal transduction histidine kinase
LKNELAQKIINIFKKLKTYIISLKSKIFNLKNENKKEGFNGNSLTFTLWLYFVLFAASLFLILWFMQVIFLQSYYSSMKKGEVIKLASELEEAYIKGDFTEYMDKIAYKNVSNIFIYDLDGNLKYSSENSFRQNESLAQIPIHKNNFDIESIVAALINNPDKKINYTLKIDRVKSEMFIYGSVMKDADACIVMVTSIDPIDSTTSVLQNQLIYITIISLVIASVISIFISKNLSKPISKINETAKKLAQGNYDITFEKAGYTEIDDLADTLNFATEELSKTDKVRKELIANVSHDLRTPLTMIKAYSEMIRDLSGDNKDKREEHLKVIIDETDRLTRLVNDMMDLSKLESGLTKINKEKFDLSEVTKNILNGFKNINENEKCKISVDLPEKSIVFADKTKIEQVIYNLVTNAINHSGEEKNILVKITITGKKVKLQVIDNGPGISKEDLPHIWNRYYKADKTFKRASNGTGLGLSIVKNILEKNDAEYGVESEVGKGSTFWFELDKK